MICETCGEECIVCGECLAQEDEQRPMMFADVWRKVARLIKQRAVHRSGFTLGEVLPAFIIKQAGSELIELASAEGAGDSEATAEELADLFGVLIHLAQVVDVDERKLCQLMIGKFQKRFTEPDTC